MDAVLDAEGLRIFLIVLLELGVPAMALIQIQPILAKRVLTVGFGASVRRMLHVTRATGCSACAPPDTTIAAFLGALQSLRARRLAHIARLTELAMALAPMPIFRRNPGILQQVVSCLAGRCGRPARAPDHGPARRSVSADADSTQYLCTASGCRFKSPDILEFMQHVQDHHMGDHV
jgi:hypothetical protein